MVKQEFEMISHQETNFKLFLVHMLYRTPHVHQDIELCLLLKGRISLMTQHEVLSLRQGDFFMVNPFQSHELKAESPALLLSLQVHPSFFSSAYPQIENLEFTSCHLPKEADPDAYKRIFSMVIDLAGCYLKKPDYFELKCAGLLTMIFVAFLECMPHRMVTDREKSMSKTKGKRMRKMIRYIDEHYEDKLLLSEMAEKEGLSLSYLSHFFKDCFGISFQEYLLKIRCEKACRLLLLTDRSLLDICMSCGFSDPKYFNHGFKGQYGCSPKDYRKKFYHQEQKPQNSLLTSQEFLSPAASLAVLEEILDHPRPADQEEANGKSIGMLI